MLKLIGMLLRCYYPQFMCRCCGYRGIADMRYRTLVPGLILMVPAAGLFVFNAAVFVWAGFYFLPNWIIGIPLAWSAIYFLFIYKPDLFCPKCSGISGKTDRR